MCKPQRHKSKPVLFLTVFCLLSEEQALCIGKCYENNIQVWPSITQAFSIKCHQSISVECMTDTGYYLIPTLQSFHSSKTAHHYQGVMVKANMFICNLTFTYRLRCNIIIISSVLSLVHCKFVSFFCGLRENVNHSDC